MNSFYKTCWFCVITDLVWYVNKHNNLKYFCLIIWNNSTTNLFGLKIACLQFRSVHLGLSLFLCKPDLWITFTLSLCSKLTAYFCSKYLIWRHFKPSYFSLVCAIHTMPFHVAKPHLKWTSSKDFTTFQRIMKNRTSMYYPFIDPEKGNEFGVVYWYLLKCY